MNNLQKKIICPTCNKNNTWTAENAYRPFCSERCRLIDLGAWASESYAIAAENQSDEMLEEEEQGHPNRSDSQ